MSRTYRRYTNKSQNKTVHFMQNIFHERQENSFNGHFHIVKYKGDNKFFTDNQKVPNWNFSYHAMNKKSRHEAKNALRKIKSIPASEEILFKYYKGKHQFSKFIWLYFY